MYGVPPPWHEFLLLLAVALVAALVAAMLPRPHGPSPQPSPRGRGGSPLSSAPKELATSEGDGSPPLPLGEAVLPAAAGRTGEGRLWDAAYAAAFTLALLQLVALAMLRHQSFHSQALDLGSLAQVAWNTAQGRWFESSVIPTTTNLLAEHFSPVFLLIAPLYHLFPDPRLLLFLQAAGLALGSLPLYLLARRRLGRPLGLALAVAFLLSPPLLYLDLADFHEIAFAVPLLSGALYFLALRRWAPMALMLGGTLLLREEMGFVVAAFGLWVLGDVMRARRPRSQERDRCQGLWGVAIFACGLMWALGTILVIVPAIRGGSPYPYLDRYAYLGADLPAMVATLLLRPLDVIRLVATPERLDFVARLLLPWGLLPLLGSPLLLGLPTLAYTLLSQDPAQWDLQSQYHAPLIPIVAFAALAAIERLVGHSGGVRARRALAAFLIVAAGLSYLLHGPGLLARGFDGGQYRSTERGQRIHDVLGSIPAEAGVATQTNLVPHLASRRHLYLLPWVRDWAEVDNVLLDRRGNRYPLGDDEYERLEGDLTSRLGFERVLEVEDLALYRRRM